MRSAHQAAHALIVSCALRSDVLGHLTHGRALLPRVFLERSLRHGVKLSSISYHLALYCVSYCFALCCARRFSGTCLALSFSPALLASSLGRPAIWNRVLGRFWGLSPGARIVRAQRRHHCGFKTIFWRNLIDWQGGPAGTNLGLGVIWVEALLAWFVEADRLVVGLRRFLAVNVLV